MKIGYARVSTNGQDHSTQIERLKSAGAEKVFEEKRSGLDGDREELAKALEYAREGDVLMVTKLDRLARSAVHLHQMLDMLDRKGVGFRVLDDAALDTTTRSGKLMFGILASMAEFETAIRKERQMEGINKAKAEGRWNPGRPKALNYEWIKALRAEERSIREIAKEVGCSVGAVHKVLAGDKEEKEQ